MPPECGRDLGWKVHGPSYQMFLVETEGWEEMSWELHPSTAPQAQDAWATRGGSSEGPEI